MEVKILGCGTAFSLSNFNQSFLLTEDYKGKTRKLLIDFGFTGPFALKYHGLTSRDINDIYISHAHADHIGGLEMFAFSQYDWVTKPQHWSEFKNTTPPVLYCNQHLLNELWEYSLKGGLESMEGFVATIETFFQTKPVKPNDVFFWQGWECKLVQQIHIMTGSSIKNSFGLIMTQEGRKSVYFTTDSQHCSPRQVEIFYREPDIIFQDCELLPIDYTSGVHANYAQLAGYPEANSVILDAEVKSKMWLSHYQDFKLKNKDFFGNDCNWDEKAAKDGFAGFLYIGQTFDV